MMSSVVPRSKARFSTDGASPRLGVRAPRPRCPTTPDARGPCVAVRACDPVVAERHTGQTRARIRGCRRRPADRQTPGHRAEPGAGRGGSGRRRASWCWPPDDGSPRASLRHRAAALPWVTMCGIVGYVGQRPARDVVVDALRRMEYRGYDSVGPRGSRRPRRNDGAQARGPAGQPGGGARGDRPRGARRAAPASATPAGPPTAGPPTATPTRTATPRARSRSCTTASSRTSPPLRAELEADGVEFASDTDTEVAVHLVARAYRHGDTAGDFVGSRAGGAAPPRGPLHAGVRQRRRPGHDRRGPPLHAAGGRHRRRRDVPRLRRRRVHRAHPRRRRTRPGPGRGDHRRRLSDHRLRRQRRRRTCSCLSHRLGPVRRREGRLRLLHAQGDRRAARRGAPTPCSGTSSTAASCSTSSGCPTRNCARSTRSSSWPAAPPTTPGCWPSTPSSTGRGCPSRSSWPASSATATRCWTAARWWSRSRSPARPPTRWRRCGTPRSRRPRCWRSATPTAARSRASATRCSTPAPGRRSASRRPRRSWRRSRPTTWSGLALAQARGTKYPDEVEREYRELEAMPELVARVLDDLNRSPRWPAGSRSRRRCCSSAATSATRSRSRVRSSSRNWRTCTPRASRRASSSTARSR